MTQMVKNPPAMQETGIPSLGREDPLDKGMAAHSSILAWKIPWMEELYKKDLHNPDNHDGVITHLEPVRNRTLGPPLENHPETPPSSPR